MVTPGVFQEARKTAKKIARRLKLGQQREPIYFLHIGKNAGTQVGHIIEQINARLGDEILRKVGHQVPLRSIPKSSPYFFSVRSPVSRFRSGFYSRKREGRPRIHKPWSAMEREAFSRFPHANDLAESLFAPGQLGFDATAAILSISHNAMNQVRWFEGNGFALQVRPPLWIIRQENFAADMRVLLERAELPTDFDLATDKTGSHANDYSDTPPLSDLAKGNLERWYAQDAAFYALCANWLASQEAKAGSGDTFAAPQQSKG